MWTRTFVRWRFVGLLLLLILSFFLTSCFRIVRPEDNPESNSDNHKPVIVTGILMAYGGAIAQWSDNVTISDLGPNVAKLQIPPGGPSEVPHAYVALDNVIPTINDIEKLESKYFVLPHSTCDFSPYFCICIDLDGDGTGCDEFIIGGFTEEITKNQWSTLSPPKWRIVSHGYEEKYSLDEVKNILGNEPIVRIRVSVGSWDTEKSMTVYVDGIVVNDTTYNLEPGELSPQGNQPFVND
jgi:hypothetical protein